MSAMLGQPHYPSKALLNGLGTQSRLTLRKLDLSTVPGATFGTLLNKKYKKVGKAMH